MLSAISVAENRSCQVLLTLAPKGTPSSIFALRLRRHFHHLKASYGKPPQALLSNVSLFAVTLRNNDGVLSRRYATTHSSSSPLSQDAIAHLQSLLIQPGNEASPAVEPAERLDTVDYHLVDGAASANGDMSTKPADPFRQALLAMREGDTRRTLLRLAVIERMTREELQAAAANLPRTTFTEFFRALDPFRVSRDCDALDDTYVSAGMFKKLYMDSSVDHWGVRTLYTRLMRRILVLMRILKDCGHPLHLEEYIVLLRCAGVACDIYGAGALWNDINDSPVLQWRNSEVYTEYIKARFLTEPLYTNHQKIMRLVTPRNLHRSRLEFKHHRAIMKMDGVRLRIRRTKYHFGLNKDIPYVEELMRVLRGHKPAVRLFWTVVATNKFRPDESLMCALMVALGRAGSLRFIGVNILQTYFGIRTPHASPLQPEGEWAKNIAYESGPARLRPTVRLMRAVVETYGSNGEVAVAVQLVEYLSNTYNIPIPQDVWADLLEWTHILSTPPASIGWEAVRWFNKVPSPYAVEMIWNAMISPPYNQKPTFKNYNVLIRSLIARDSDDPTPILALMREAIALFDAHCKEYEAVVFDYSQQLRDGIAPAVTIHRFEYARFKRSQMWYNISEWCRMLLRHIPISETSPVPTPLAADIVREFRRFFSNPIEYDTPTGHVSLRDPSLRGFKVITTGVTEQKLRMKGLNGKWIEKPVIQRKVAVLSKYSLAPFKSAKTRNPMDILEPGLDAFHRPDSATPSEITE